MWRLRSAMAAAMRLVRSFSGMCDGAKVFITKLVRFLLGTCPPSSRRHMVSEYKLGTNVDDEQEQRNDPEQEGVLGQNQRILIDPDVYQQQWAGSNDHQHPYTPRALKRKPRTAGMTPAEK